MSAPPERPPAAAARAVAVEVAPPAPAKVASIEAPPAAEPAPEIELSLADAEAEEGPDPEAEEHVEGTGDTVPDATADLTDDELAHKWEHELESLGSISLGFVDDGRLINAVHFPKSQPEQGWVMTSPGKAWATQETIDYILAAVKKVKEWHPDAPPLRVNQISAKDGGWLRPHKSHQNGRDVDFGLYYPGGEIIHRHDRENHLDPKLNWALVKALIIETDVQLILIDRRIIKVLRDYALASGENAAWLAEIFDGPKALVKHARRHRDHFHVRFYNPRAQELGRRVAPLLAKRPEHNLATHRVRKGDTLGAIAIRYGSTVNAIRKASRIRGSFLRIGQLLKIPLRGPCTRCPVPPQLVLPPRRLPPPADSVASAGSIARAP